MQKIISLLLCLLLVGLLLSGCGAKTPDAGTGNFRVVTTIFPVYDFVRAVAGDSGKADITLLLRAGAEIHSYDPSPKDIIAIQEADLFIYIGGESDVWVDGILASMGDKRPATLRLIDFVDAVEEELSPGMEEDHDDAQGGGHEYDEHIWTSPRNAVKLVDAVSAAMAGADPDNAEIYKTNGKKYGDAIAALDDQFRQMIQSATRRKIVVGDKFPFRYFVDEYGLSYAAAFPACSTESDCSAATMAYLVDYIKSEQIPVIYTIELSTQTVAKALAEETGAQILTLQSCHNVTVKDFEAGATYLSLMTQNLDNLRKGLA